MCLRANEIKIVKTINRCVPVNRDYRPVSSLTIEWLKMTQTREEMVTKITHRDTAHRINDYIGRKSFPWVLTNRTHDSHVIVGTRHTTYIF